MKRNVAFSAILAGLTSVGFAPPLAAKTWLDFINLGQQSSNTRLRIDCEGLAPYDALKCRITSYHFYRMTDEDKKRYRAQFIDVDAASDSELNQLWGMNSSHDVAHDTARMATATPDQRASW